MISLQDREGHRFRLVSQANTLIDRGVQMKLIFSADSPESTPHRLQVTHPHLRSRRDMEIVFRGVPLLNARPE